MFGHVTYIAITALVVNLAVAAVLTLVFRAVRLPDGYDETRPGHYTVDPVPAAARPAGWRGRGGRHDRPRPGVADRTPADEGTPQPLPPISPRPVAGP